MTQQEEKQCSCCLGIKKSKNGALKWPVQNLVALEALDKNGKPYYVCPKCDSPEPTKGA